MMREISTHDQGRKSGLGCFDSGKAWKGALFYFYDNNTET